MLIMINIMDAGVIVMKMAVNGALDYVLISYVLQQLGIMVVKKMDILILSHLDQ